MVGLCLRRSGLLPATAERFDATDLGDPRAQICQAVIQLHVYELHSHTLAVASTVFDECR